jgi:hypothetical protein
MVYLAGARKTASRLAVALGIAIALAPTLGRAEVQVRGTPQAVTIEARDATEQEILVALSTKYKIQFRSAANLDKQLTPSMARCSKRCREFCGATISYRKLAKRDRSRFPGQV